MNKSAVFHGPAHPAQREKTARIRGKFPFPSVVLRSHPWAPLPLFFLSVLFVTFCLILFSVEGPTSFVADSGHFNTLTPPILLYETGKPLNMKLFLRGVAQLGRALRSGRRGRWFKSSRPDFHRPFSTHLQDSLAQVPNSPSPVKGVSRGSWESLGIGE